MTGSQLSSFIRRNRIIIPDNCSKSRDSLSKLVLESYTKWDDVLCDEETTVNEIIEAFNCIDDQNDIDHAKACMRKKMQLILPGEESLIMWLKTKETRFCPVLKKTPGPHTHKMLLTSWLHDCSLLHVASIEDTRPTRVFSDNDARTTSLHLRRDAYEGTLTLCKQLAWKEPSAYSDSGSMVYCRADAVVTHPEYNTRFLTYLHLQLEGRIERVAGIDQATTVSFARQRWLQIKASRETDDLQKDLQRNILSQLLEEEKEKAHKLEEKVDELQRSVNEMIENLKKVVEMISEYVITSTQSADDLGQHVLTKFKKRKLKHTKI